MKTTMDMSSYEIEQDEMEVEYGVEVMSSEWDPEDELFCGLQEIGTSAEVSSVASAICLRKMYSYQH